MMARKSLKEILDSCKGKPPWGVRFRVGQAGEGKINKAMGSMMPNEQLKFCRDFLLVMETGRGGDGKACGEIAELLDDELESLDKAKAFSIVAYETVRQAGVTVLRASGRCLMWQGQMSTLERLSGGCRGRRLILMNTSGSIKQLGLRCT